MQLTVRQPWSVLVLIAAGWIGWTQGGESSCPFVEQPDAFVGGKALHLDRPFEVITGDMDLDGDLDVLANWHHLHPLELYENRDGQYHCVNVPGADSTGLDENRLVPLLFATEEEMAEKIEQDDSGALFLWHDMRRAPTHWVFHYKPPSGVAESPSVRIALNRDILEFDGLQPEEILERSGMELRLKLNSDSERHFSVQVLQAATRLEVEVDFAGQGRLLVGPQAKPVADGRFCVWKPDPHGMAWVNVQGSPRPDLYITRGGLRGELQPPLDPKTDRFFEGLEPATTKTAGGLAPLYGIVDDGVVPPDYARGRSVEWVDIDGDGKLELSIAAKEAANRLLVRSGEHFVDRAQELGLDFLESDVQAWADHDGDGRQDLYYVQDRQVHLARNIDGKSFEFIAGETLGLSLPKPGISTDVINSSSIVLCDHDNDGDLDLWVIGYGKMHRTRVFERGQEVFEDVTDALGLLNELNYDALVQLDIDNDGWLDAISLGRKCKLWINRGGHRFDVQLLPRDWLDDSVEAATRCDSDGDGRQDLVLAGTKLHLMRNVSLNDNRFVRVRLSSAGAEPIGALVTAVVSRGGRHSIRYGSADKTTFSQSLLPLHFGLAKGVEVERFEVHWPTEKTARVYEGPFAGSEVVLER